MSRDELTRALGGTEPPVNEAHRARLEGELLAAYDARHGVRAPRPLRRWARYATAATFVLCLVTATQVPAEYKVEVGKRLELTLPAGVPPPEGLGERVAATVRSGRERVVDVQVRLRRHPGGETVLRVDVWGDGLVGDAEVLERLRTLPELRGQEPTVQRLEGRVRDNLMGALGHRLFRAGASPGEREAARQRLIEELRRIEGEGAEVDVQVDDDGSRMRVKVRKR
jgi:hypothetical protein